MSLAQYSGATAIEGPRHEPGKSQYITMVTSGCIGRDDGRYVDLHTGLVLSQGQFGEQGLF